MSKETNKNIKNGIRGSAKAAYHEADVPQHAVVPNAQSVGRRELERLLLGARHQTTCTAQVRLETSEQASAE